VDDRRENLVALAAVLEPLGMEMVLARSGSEALKHLLTDDFAVILLDVQMPGMDGFEAATLIKQRERSRFIPIIFVTAIDKDEHHVYRGYQSGAVDYLAKPIDPDLLRSKVRVFIELDQQRRRIVEQAEELRRAELREAELLREEAERERERVHHAEIAERETQLRHFKATLDATLDAVFLFDPQTLRFSYVNQGAVALLGYRAVDILGKTPLDLEFETSRENLERVLAPLRGGAANGQSSAHTYETQVRHKSGAMVPVEVLTQYVAPAEGDARYISVVRDISERRRAEALLARMYEREKRIAEALQQSIVLAPPEDLFPGLTIASLYQAAWDEANVGGDYLDVFALEKGKVSLIVGDVSGKGLAAAARTAEVKYALRAFLRESADPARALDRLNTLLCETSRLDNAGALSAFPVNGQFICVSVIVLDPKTGIGLCALAGSEPPIIIRRSESVDSIPPGGMPIGVSPDETHSNVDIQLEKGDVLLLATDGITEARQGRSFFGYDGLVRAAAEAAGTGTVQQVAKAVLESARRFAGGKLQDDACLLLATRY
jgi:PAS domain S-box-containing protein